MDGRGLEGDALVCCWSGVVWGRGLGGVWRDVEGFWNLAHAFLEILLLLRWVGNFRVQKTGTLQDHFLFSRSVCDLAIV